MQLHAAQIAYIDYLKASEQRVIHMTGDSDWDELYIVTTARGAKFLVHTLIDKGRDTVIVDHFDTMAEAISFTVNQAVHTYLFCCEEASPMQTYKEGLRSKDEASLGRAIGNNLAHRNRIDKGE
ncbi:hypothetical protein [Paracoccus litorisediminis]|uniref:Uncharacterized protein n=1 Tax=Paracoccus litorisediminis TaxID=2006130 RepID=A0A844HRW3_9RHOB|nr:hypothetical protein [Paracoccus litorisediminis]MTH61174.1 hypothetical protein [Paracoccus litorisediminis]